MQTVIGLFENAHDAQKAAQKLMSDGFTSDNVDVSLRESGSETSGYSAGGSDTGGLMGGSTLSDTSGSSTLSGTTGTSGLTSGAGSSSLTGTSGYTSGSDYGTGSANTGSSSSDYSHSGEGDGFGDKVSRFFKNLFGGDDDSDQANRYSHVASKTGCVVTVYAQSKDEAERAADILDDNGAIDVDQRASEYGYSGGSYSGMSSGTDTDSTGTYTSGTGSTGSYSAGIDSDVSQNEKLNVIKEDIQVGKREVETGGVRLRSRIVERPVEESVRLRQERVTVQRTAVDRPATTADFQNFKEGEIEMTEYAEVPEVTKQARIVEEVSLQKEVTERTETINETARDTEVDIEDLSKNDLTSNRNTSL